MRALPRRRVDSARRMQVRVDRGSLIRVDKNVYSVNSRLIGEQVDVRVYADHVEVWYGQRQVETLDRLRGRGPVAQCTVRPDRVVLDTPALDQNLGFQQRVKDLAVQQLIPQFPVCETTTFREQKLLRPTQTRSLTESRVR